MTRTFLTVSKVISLFLCNFFLSFYFFFFQAEDGIRDHCVTGVQTCALPISPPWLPPHRERRRSPSRPRAPARYESAARRRGRGLRQSNSTAASQRQARRDDRAHRCVPGTPYGRPSRTAVVLQCRRTRRDHRTRCAKGSLPTSLWSRHRPQLPRTVRKPRGISRAPIRRRRSPKDASIVRSCFGSSAERS